MTPLYQINITLHILAAMLWLGGMFFLALVGAPVLRTLEPAVRRDLFERLGVRFRLVGWSAIAVLLATGFVNLYLKGLLVWDGVLAEPDFWKTPFGHALAGKVIAVTVMLTVSVLHDFVLGPAASRAVPGSTAADSNRKVAMLLARSNAIVGVILVVLAVRLARGG